MAPITEMMIVTKGRVIEFIALVALCVPVTVYLLFPVYLATPETRGASSRPATKAVIHMGVPKTGSTSIQKDSLTFSHQLKMDGYDMPWLHWDETNLRQSDKPKLQPTQRRLKENLINFATCFLDPS
jgi:hypothetical protein